MLAFDGFKVFADELARLNGLSEDEAAEVAAVIGDTPEVDDQGRVLVNGRAYIMPMSEDDE